MKRSFLLNSIVLGIGLAVLISCFGCGYTMKATLPEGVASIAVPNFKNAIPPSVQYTYEAGLAIDVTNKVIDQLLFDGNLRVKKLDEADSILEGEIIRYQQESVRYDSLERVRQYRLFIVVDITYRKADTGEIIWREPNFSGDAEYFLEGANAMTERAAADKAIEDLAKKIVDRIIEDW